MKKSRFVRLAFAACLALAPASMQAQLLKGTLRGASAGEAVVTYNSDGNIYNSQLFEVPISADGTFSFDMPLSASWADVTLEIDNVGYFGLQLLKDATLEMSITVANGKANVSFKGGKKGVCEYLNRSTRAYDMMRYWSQDETSKTQNAEYRALLDSEHQAASALLKDIKDKDLRSYYTKLDDAQYTWMRLRLIMDDCYEKGIDTKDDAEYQQLLKNIDVNDDICFRTNLSYTALSNMVKSKMEGSNETYCYELMDITDRYVKKPKIRTMMVQSIAQNYFIYGNGEGDAETFTKRLKAFAGKDSAIVVSAANDFFAKRQALTKTTSGNKAPDITLTAKDGKEVNLSSLIGNGKFTYIDVWATWCGPCVKEIPHMERLVEKYKDNDKVQFISISIDQNQEAWRKKIDNDRPQWAQYVLTDEREAVFSKDWGISGIPRFIMINGDGTVFSNNATRPSDEKTAQTIDEMAGH